MLASKCNQSYQPDMRGIYREKPMHHEWSGFAGILLTRNGMKKKMETFLLERNDTRSFDYVGWILRTVWTLIDCACIIFVFGLFHFRFVSILTYY